MPKRERAPQISDADLSKTSYKNRKRRIKILVDLRLSYGKSAFWDTSTHQPRYSKDEIGKALRDAIRQWHRIGRDLDLSSDEEELLREISRQE